MRTFIAAAVAGIVAALAGDGDGAVTGGKLAARFWGECVVGRLLKYMPGWYIRSMRIYKVFPKK